MGNIVSLVAGMLGLSLVGAWVLGATCGHLTTVYALAAKIKGRFRLVMGGFCSTTDDINTNIGCNLAG